MALTRLLLVGFSAIFLLSGDVVRAQPGGLLPAPRAAQTETPKEPPKDTLGRDTPRGTLLGFMKAAQDGRGDVAPLYLDTTLRGQSAAQLAHQLYVVLDHRLPPRLDVSDQPEGSVPNLLKPNEDIIGTIETNDGPLDIKVERVNRGDLGPVWLFSRATLQEIPGVFGEIDLVSVDRFVPGFLIRFRLAGVRLFEWVALLLLAPLTYRVTGLLFGLLGVLVRPLMAVLRHRFGLTAQLLDLQPGPIRLLVMAAAIHWFPASLDIPLAERQFWSAIATMLVTVAFAWLFLLLNAAGERLLLRRLKGREIGELAALLRLARRLADVVVIAVVALIALHYFQIDATAALAGLGIGGIAVALAAQKTLENIVGGLSIVFDKAVGVGDVLKLGDTLGTVDSVGLRSTRIRTLDRTILSVPNGQVATANIETLSARDKFWFHHFVGLSYQTTPAQMRTVIERIRDVLVKHPGLDRADVLRVRFFRLGQFSLDIEVSAYIFANDWDRFLEIQQDLLLRIMEIVEQAGTNIALPSQTLNVTQGSIWVPSDVTPASKS
jgi:MscS family membrane protein